ncbi:hypothetical protein OEA41_008133 [Lepraria neglecta]|uniref:Uncharacterized protein n=1 Tax=Lepraria neglecta TaxID=209136 RepID=A0AAD9ZE39_9LECA|nr:hypothetical protein OEA41_008133 [Lepraria neglecta]
MRFEGMTVLMRPDFGLDNFTLRLAWEYFECIRYDVELYNKLVQRKLVEETAALMGQHVEQGGDIEMA